MDHQTSPKRSLALPITLVLLTFSLIGNVFLYSQYLQNGQEDKYQTGQHIAASAARAESFYKALLLEVERMYSDDQSERIDAKFDAVSAFRSAEGVMEFIGQAHEINGTELQIDALGNYVSGIEFSIEQVGNHEGPLTAAEKTYLSSLQEALTKQHDIILKFNFDAAESRSLSIQLGNGMGWTDIADLLEQAINEHKDYTLTL